MAKDLILLGYWSDFSYVDVTILAMSGGILGVFFSIPLRRALIVEGNLKFPEGVATAEVLVAGDEGGEGIRVISLAAIVGALVKAGQAGFKLLAGSVSGAFTVGHAAADALDRAEG